MTIVTEHGMVNGIDLADTVDVRPMYCEVVYLLQCGHEGLAETWLRILSEEY